MINKDYLPISEKRAIELQKLTRAEIAYVTSIQDYYDTVDDVAYMIRSGFIEDDKLIKFLTPVDYGFIADIHENTLAYYECMADEDPDSYEEMIENPDLFMAAIISRYAQDVYNEYGFRREWPFVFPKDGPTWTITDEEYGIYAIKSTVKDKTNEQAAAEAAKTGIPIIKVTDIPPNFEKRRYKWLDFPGNMAAIRAHACLNGWPVEGAEWMVGIQRNTNIMRVIPFEDDDNSTQRRVTMQAQQDGVPVLHPKDVPEGYWGYGWINTPDNIAAMKRAQNFKKQNSNRRRNNKCKKPDTTNSQRK